MAEDVFSNDDRAYLAMLQGNITRMATNSLYCKVLCGAFIPVLASSSILRGCSFLVCALLLLGASLYLDVLYLSLEKAYRDKYNKYYKAVLLSDYSIRNQIFDMNPSGYLNFDNKFKSLKSWSIWVPYGAFFFCALIVSASK